MVDTGIFATTVEVQRKVGANASSTSNVEAFINQYMTEAESKINALTKINWSNIYSSLDVDTKGILKEAASNLAAIYVLSYDMTNFVSREIETRLDVLTWGFKDCIEILKQKANSDFIQSPSGS